MNSYNKIERAIADFLSKNPKLKRTIKYIYQYLNFLFHRKNVKLINHYDSILVRYGSEKKESFFGYYNNSPINNSGNVAWIEVEGERASIVIDGKNISKTKAFNLQQGCMLTWINDEALVFNDIEDDGYCAKIINKNGEILNKISKPIYTIAGNREFALTLDFERLSLLRPDYGYFINWGYDLENYNDGIYKISLDNNDIEQILTLEQILNYDFKNNCDYKHKLNHIDICPDNYHFMFIHRWFDSLGKKESRLILADIEGNINKVIVNEGMVSHCCWYDVNNIIGWFKYSGQNNYYKYNIQNNSFIKIDDKNKLLSEDGHPSIRNGYLLTDTYPDKSRFSHIMIYNFKSNNGVKILSLFNPMKYFEENRCDLHPRWGKNGSIFFDATFEGKRFLYECTLKGVANDFGDNECI